MAKTIAFETPFKTGEKVRALAALPDVPEGTKGKVQLANGFRWKRYWVRFDNGVSLGQIDHDGLVRAKDWDRWHAGSASGQVAVGAGAGVVDTAGADHSGGGGGVTVNGVTIPQFLLDRSSSARSRLGG